MKAKLEELQTLLEHPGDKCIASDFQHQVGRQYAITMVFNNDNTPLCTVFLSW